MFLYSSLAVSNLLKSSGMSGWPNFEVHEDDSYIENIDATAEEISAMEPNSVGTEVVDNSAAISDDLLDIPDVYGGLALDDFASFI
jgi:hypothetical protein